MKEKSELKAIVFNKDLPSKEISLIKSVVVCFIMIFSFVNIKYRIKNSLPVDERICPDGIDRPGCYAALGVRG